MTGEAGSHEKPPSLAGMPPSGCQFHNPQEASHGRQLNDVPLLSCTCLSFCPKSLQMHTCAIHTNSHAAAHLWELLPSTLSCVSIIPSPSTCAFLKSALVWKLGSPFPEFRPLVVNDWQAGNRYLGQGCQIKLWFVHSQFLLIFVSYKENPRKEKAHVHFTISRSEFWWWGANCLVVSKTCNFPNSV